MTVTAPPPTGQDPWGDTLNEYLAYLEGRIATLEISDSGQTAAIVDNTGMISELEGRVALLEDHAGFHPVSGTWTFSSAAPPPTGSQVRLNNSNPQLATQIAFRVIDLSGQDRTALFATNITRLRIQDFTNSTLYYDYNVTGLASVVGGVATLPVTWRAGAGTVPNQKVQVTFLTAFP